MQTYYERLRSEAEAEPAEAPPAAAHKDALNPSTAFSKGHADVAAGKGSSKVVASKPAAAASATVGCTTYYSAPCYFHALPVTLLTFAVYCSASCYNLAL